MKFYRCEYCGKIVAMIKETPLDTVCCGRPMRELVSGTTDGATEKHVPVCRIDGNTVNVIVGAVAHPMMPAHHIEWIAIETERGHQCRRLEPMEKPQASFALVSGDAVKSVYAYCNLHGLWKTSER